MPNKFTPHSITPNQTYMQTSLVAIVEDLSALLDTEFHILSENNASTEQKLRPIVQDKQALADEYAAYCTMFHTLPEHMKENMAEFAKDHIKLLDGFTKKLKRNLTLIEARYRRSELRVQAVMDAIQADGNASSSYGAKADNVIPMRRPMSHDIAS